MAVIVTHVSAKLVLRLNAGNGGDKRITINGIRESASVDALWDIAQAVGALLQYPVEAVELHTVSSIERRDEDSKERGESLFVDRLRTDRHPSSSSSSAVKPLRAMFFGFTDFMDNIISSVSSPQRDILGYCRMAWCRRHRAPPSRFA